MVLRINAATNEIDKEFPTVEIKFEVFVSKGFSLRYAMKIPIIAPAILMLVMCLA